MKRDSSTITRYGSPVRHYTPYAWRSAGPGSAKTIDWGQADWGVVATNATAVEMIKMAHAEDIEFRSFITDVNEFYALAGSNTDTSTWAAYQVRDAAWHGKRAGPVCVRDVNRIGILTHRCISLSNSALCNPPRARASLHC
jgi:hypothetical protein